MGLNACRFPPGQPGSIPTKRTPVSVPPAPQTGPPLSSTLPFFVDRNRNRSPTQGEVDREKGWVSLGMDKGEGTSTDGTSCGPPTATGPDRGREVGPGPRQASPR